MKQFFYPKLVLRSPSMSIEEYWASSFEQLLSNHRFRLALKHANPMFFKLVARKAFDVSKLTDQEVLTLKKYLNRMCFRPTPFGLFSSFSVIDWKAGRREAFFSKEQEYIHLLPDQMVNHRLNELYKEYTDPSNEYYRSNMSCYLVHHEIRFLQTFITNGVVEYQLQSVPANYVNRKILKFCSQDRQLSDIIEFLQNEVSCEPEDAQYYCAFLIENGMLVPSFFFNVAGTSHYSRLIEQVGGDSEFYKSLLSLDKTLKSSDPDLAERFIKELLGNSHRNVTDQKPMLYINMERRITSDNVLSASVQPGLMAALECCLRLGVQASSPDLTQFVRIFKERYDLQQVPLLKVLDPEVGIGYGNMAYDLFLLKDLTFQDQAERPDQKWSDVHIFLLKLWNEGRTTEYGSPMILIKEENLDSLPVSESQSLPPSFSVVFRFTGDDVFIESAGGASATQLAGRFTLFNAELRDSVRDIVNYEERMNPGVVFAEIVHLTGAHTDNINQRETLYGFDLLVSGQSVLPKEKQILLSDIFVSVRNNQVVLFSKRLNKILIPRLSSAYNYKLNDLPVFRFLCDVQNQGIKTNLSLDLASLFPGLDLYPRVVYKNSILYPATWRLKGSTIRNIVLASSEKQLSLFNELADKIGLSGYFSISRGDRYLVFDRQSEDDVRFFIKSVTNKEDVILKEFFPPDSSSFSLKDEQGRLYGHQFIGLLVNKERVYDGRPGNIHAVRKQRVFLPGSEWLYIKIYCKPGTSNYLLGHILIPFIHKERHEISKWFFVRYNDPYPHIRLRLKIDSRESGSVIKYIGNRLEKEILSGLVTSYVVDVYQRELERYGAAIDMVEEVFYEGSQLAGCLLKGMESVEHPVTEYSITFVSLLSLFRSATLGSTFVIDLFEGYYSGLFAEFKGSKMLKVQLDQKYRMFKRELERWEEIGEKKVYSYSARRCQKSFNRAVHKLLAFVPEKEHKKYLSDVIHMQINRMLTDEHRKQELVIAYCLYKHYISASKRQLQVH